jgi:hypothetical protein
MPRDLALLTDPLTDLPVHETPLEHWLRVGELRKWPPRERPRRWRAAKRRVRERIYVRVRSRDSQPPVSEELEFVPLRLIRR